MLHRPIHLLSRLILMSCIACQLSCGQKGPLYHPPTSIASLEPTNTKTNDTEKKTANLQE